MAHASGHCEAAEIVGHALTVANLPPEAPLDLASLSLISVLWTRINSAFTADQHTYSAWQVGLAALRRYLGAVLCDSAELRRLPFGQTLSIVAQVQNVSLVSCGIARALLWAHGDVLPELSDRADLARLEAALSVPGLLTAVFDRMPHALPLFPEPVPAAIRHKCLGAALEYLRAEKGQTVAGMLKSAGLPVTDALINRICALTTGRRLPTDKDRVWMTKIAALYGPEYGLLEKFETEAKIASRLPGRVRAEVHRFWSESLESQYCILARHKHPSSTTLAGSKGCWNPVSTEKNRRDLGFWAAYLHLPSDSTEPRLNGAGIPAAEVSLGLLAITDLWRGYFLYRAHRAQVGRNCRGHAAIAETVASLVRPGTGALWIEAEYFSGLPGVLSRCPAAATGGDEAAAGDVILRVARFRAACTQTNEYLKIFAHTVRNDPELMRPSRNPVRKIEQALSTTSAYPLEILCGLLARLEAQLIRPVTTKEAAQLQRILAVLSIAVFRPFRSSVWEELTLGMVIALPNGGVNLAVPPRLIKTRHSFRGRRGCFVTLPASVAGNVLRYLSEGRRVLAHGESRAGDWFLLNRSGGKFATDSLTEQLTRVAQAYAPDLFPLGLSPHDIRHLLACDLFRRFGTERGSELSAESHLDTPTTLRNSYAHEALASFRWSGESTQEAALLDALAQARASAARRTLPAA